MTVAREGYRVLQLQQKRASFEALFCLIQPCEICSASRMLAVGPTWFMV